MEEICKCTHEHPKVDAFLSSSELARLEEFYSAFSTKSRLILIDALCKAEMCVCELARHAKMTKSAVSHQLRVLKEGGLIKSRKAGKEVFYSLADEHVKMLFEISIEHINELEGEQCEKNI